MKYYFGLLSMMVNAVSYKLGFYLFYCLYLKMNVEAHSNRFVRDCFVKENNLVFFALQSFRNEEAP